MKRYARTIGTRVRLAAAGIAFGCACFAVSVHAQQGASRELEREVAAGVGLLDGSSFRYGKYTGLVGDGVEALLDFRLASRPSWNGGETEYWTAEGTDLGQPSRRLGVEVGRHGQQRLAIAFEQIPRYLSDTSSTPFGGLGSGFLALPPGWAAAGDTTAGFSELAASLEAVEIRERRRRLALEYRRELGTAWQIGTSYRHDAKAGRRVKGGTIGSTGGNARAALLPAPLDLETGVVDLSATRTEARYQVALGYTGSFFRNGTPSVTWQNAFGAHPQWAPGVGFPDGLGRIALEPDNSFHQLSVGAAYAVTDSTRATASLSHGRMLQDERFLPYTVNPRLAVTEPLPRDSLDGRVDVTRLDLGVATRPSARLHVTARYRYHDRDDETPRDLYRLVRGDSEQQLAAELARINRPYSLTEHRLGLDVAYRVTRGVRVQAGYSYLDQRRDFSEVDGSDEHTFKAGLRLVRIEPLVLSIDYVHARRSVGEYVGNRPLAATRVPGSVDEDDFENHPLLRKYYLADRERDGVQARADFPVGDRVSLGLAAAYHRDDYRNSVLGLTRSSMRSYTVDGGYAAGEDWRLNAFYTRDHYANDQAGRAFTAAPGQAFDPDRNWWVDGRDRFDTAGISVELERLERHWPWLQRRTNGDAVDAGLDLVYASSTGDIDVRSAPALETEPLPSLRTRLRLYRLHGSYPLPNEARVRLAFEHERYRTRDFAFDAVEPGTIANVLDLGHDSPSYSANWLALSYLATF